MGTFVSETMSENFDNPLLREEKKRIAKEAADWLAEYEKRAEERDRAALKMSDEEYARHKEAQAAKQAAYDRRRSCVGNYEDRPSDDPYLHARDHPTNARRHWVRSRDNQTGWSRDDALDGPQVPVSVECRSCGIHLRTYHNGPDEEFEDVYFESEAGNDLKLCSAHGFTCNDGLQERQEKAERRDRKLRKEKIRLAEASGLLPNCLMGNYAGDPYTCKDYGGNLRKQKGRDWHCERCPNITAEEVQLRAKEKKEEEIRRNKSFLEFEAERAAKRQEKEIQRQAAKRQEIADAMAKDLKRIEELRIQTQMADLLGKAYVEELAALNKQYYGYPGKQRIEALQQKHGQRPEAH